MRLTGLRLVSRLIHRPVPPGPLRSPPGRILVIRPDHLGDVLFLTPALRVLRRTFSAAEVSALVGPWGAAVLAGNPDVDRLLTCEFPGFSRRPKTSPLAPYRLLLAQARRLRDLQFDAALVCRADHWWGALLAYLAAIPRRVGYDLPETRPFLTHLAAHGADRHAVEENLRLLPLLGGPVPDEIGGPEQLPLVFAPTAADVAFAETLLQRLPGADPVVALHPGAGAAVKRWTPDRAAAVAERLAAEHGCQILLTGGPDEHDLVAAVAARLRIPATTALGLTLGQLAAVLRRCRLVLGPDSGVLHLAVAVGTPTVHLFGPVDVRRFGPWGPPQRHAVVRSSLACVPCNRLDYSEAEVRWHPCIRLIDANAVLEAAAAMLAAPTR